MAKNNRPQTKPARSKARPSESSTYLTELNQAIQFHQNGQFDRAIGILQQILARDPEHVEANYALGMALHKVNRNELAIPRLLKTVALRPKMFDPMLNLGTVQRAAGRLADAQASLERAIAIKPTSSKAHVTLGLLLVDRNDIDGAARMFERAAALQPLNGEAHAQLGLIHKTRGNTEQALICYRRAVALKPQYGEAHRGLAYVRTFKEYDKDIEVMEQVYRAPSTPESERMLLGFALGKAFDDLQRYDEAFGYLLEGNRLKRKTGHFSIAKNAELFANHKRELGRAFAERHRGHATTDATAIFIVGMPRSGTSLAEQILASHPDVHGGGELEFVGQLTGQLHEFVAQGTYPGAAVSIGREAAASLAFRYLRKIGALNQSAACFTDKMPHNFLSLGLLRLMFKDLRVVHCMRHPLDTILSCFQHDFSHSHDYNLSLDSLALYYTLYMELMAHWDEVMGERIHPLRYEHMVQDQSGQSRALIGFVGLQWDESVMNFADNARRVTTPSSWQVRNKIYASSCGRWRNYEKHLAHLQDAIPVRYFS